MRSTLALACIKSQAVRIDRIRAGRSKPGLRPQHLAAARAAAAISSGALTAELGATDIRFEPQSVRPGSYRFEIGTAGSCSLVLQTVLLPLALADGESEVIIRGGTHVPWSPMFDYLEQVWLPALARLGLQVQLAINRAGFMPDPTGEIRATIAAWRPTGSIHLNGRGPVDLQLTSGLAELPEHIGERMQARAVALLEPTQSRALAIRRLRSGRPGAYLLIGASGPDRLGGFSRLGRKGLPAEQLADASVADFNAWDTSASGTDPHLADQLMLPAAMCEGASEYTTSRVTRHLQTNAWVLNQFLDDRITVRGNLDHPGRVSIAAQQH